MHVCAAILAPFDEHFAEKPGRELVTDAGKRRGQAALVAKFLHGTGEEGIAGGVLEDGLAVVVGGGDRWNRSTAAIPVVACVAVEGRERAIDGPFAGRRRLRRWRSEPADRRRDGRPLGVVERIVRRSLPRGRGKAAAIQRLEFRERLWLGRWLDQRAVGFLEVVAVGTAHGGKRRPPLLDKRRIGFERCSRRRRRAEQAGDDVPSLVVFERQCRHAARGSALQRIFQKLVESPRRPFFVEIDQRHLVGEQRCIGPPGAMTDGAPNAAVDLPPFVGIRLVCLLQRAVVQRPCRGQKVGNRRRGTIAFGVGKACDRIRHRRARLHGMGLLHIRDDPLRPEPPADLVEQRPLLGQQVRGLLLAGCVAVHAAEFAKQQEPAFDG